MWYASRTKPPFRNEHNTILTSPAFFHFAQSRAALIPGDSPRALLTTQQTDKVGSLGFRELFAVDSCNGGKSWSPMESIESLKRRRMPEGHDLVIGDACLQWHVATGVMLATGKTFGFDGGTNENHGFERDSCAIYSPTTKQRSGLKLLDLPKADHEGKDIQEPNTGCHQ